MFPVSTHGPNGISAKVTDNGELVTGALEYSSPYFASLAVNDQIYNIVIPEPKKKLIITGILISAKRNVNGDASVVIYESTSVGGTAEKTILSIDINKGINTYMALNMAATEGRWINGTTDDNTVGVTIFGYYADA